MAEKDIERRVVATQIELRASDGKKKTLVGYAAKYNARSADLGGFVEEIATGAFDAAVASDTDVLARAEHDSRMLLGRRSNGTLRLFVDEIGLRYENDLPDTSVARDLAALVERGDVKQSSFAFFVENREDEEWKATPEGIPLRVLKRVSLVDVAPVAQPAYLQTTVSARALDAAKAKGVVQPMTPVNTKPTRADFKTAVERGQIRLEQRAASSSYEEKLEATWMALYEMLGSAWPPDGSWCAPAWSIEATFDDRVIVEQGYQLLSYPLTWGADGEPMFGDPTPVEIQYVQAADAAAGAASAEARDEPAAAPDLELERLRQETMGT